MIGNYDFGFELKKKEDGFIEISMFVQNKNIMEYKYNDEIRTTTWDDLGIVDFFVYNLHYIMKEDKYPFDNDDLIGIEFTRNSNPPVDWDKYDADDEEELQKVEKYALILDSWVEKHNWSYYSNGAYIPDVTFRTKNNKIEISWNNNDLYEEDGVTYTYKEGYVYIDPITFETVIKELILEYKKLSK